MRTSKLFVAMVLASAAFIGSWEPSLSKERTKSVAQPAVKALAKRSIPDSGTLNESDLVAIAKLGDAASEDQFSADVTEKYLGREFVFVVAQDDLSTEYDKEKKKLTVSTVGWSDGFIFDKSDTRHSQYVGENGFGAKTVVSKTYGKHYGVQNPGNKYDRKPIAFEATMEGAAAREFSNALRLKITGTIQKADGIFKKSAVVVESPILADATIDSPNDIFIQQFLVASTFTKAEWIDSRTGQVVSSVNLGPS